MYSPLPLNLKSAVNTGWGRAGANFAQDVETDAMFSRGQSCPLILEVESNELLHLASCRGFNANIPSMRGLLAIPV